MNRTKDCFSIVLCCLGILGFMGCGVRTNEGLGRNLSNQVVHFGWSDVQSVGASTPVSDASDLPSMPGFIQISWNAMLPFFGEISSYNIYRAEVSNEQDFLIPLATQISAGARTYKDTSVQAGKTYYYQVRPVIDGVEFSTSQSFSEIKILASPENMSLVHRWMANLEMCNLMGRLSDPTQNYRCSYFGPGSVKGYFDFGKSLLVDTYETGCKYTPAPSCGNAIHGCLGILPPTAAMGVDGDVYFDRNRNHCWYKTAGAWKAESHTTTTSSELAQMTTNKPGAPPMVYVDQAKSWSACKGISVSGFSEPKRLPTHKEQLIAMAWPAALNHSQIDALSTGDDLPVTGNCNLNEGNGLNFDNFEHPNEIETLPCTFDSTCQLVRTGSFATQNCKTRYGMQDMVGNVNEWSSDQLYTCDSNNHSCSAGVSTLDPENSDWNGFLFNGKIGPGGGSTNVSEWQYASMGFSTTRIQLPLGLPMVTNAPSWFDSIEIGVGEGKFNPENFRANIFRINTDGTNGASVARGAFAGGSFYLSTGAGRFTLSVRNPTTVSGLNIGFRCVMDVL